jgi:hypothetical protein
MNKMTNQLRTTSFVIVAVWLLTVTCYGQSSNSDSRASNCNISRDNSEGWKRYYLEGTDGDAICVYLPQKPERFPGGKLRGGKNLTMTADVYPVAEKEETYAVVFVYDLIKIEQMSDDQKAEMFFGTWRGISENVRQVLEKRFSKPVEVKQSEQTKVNVGGHEGRIQFFTVGSYLGQARMLFTENKAYMLMGLWPQAKAEKRSASFFNSFEMRVKQ